MDKDYFNMSGFGNPPYYNYDTNTDMSSAQSKQDNDAMFNPIIQYEQAYMYYRYLSQQMEYKIKCKEYEKMTTAESTRYNNNNRKNE